MNKFVSRLVEDLPHFNEQVFFLFFSRINNNISKNYLNYIDIWKYDKSSFYTL